MAKTSTIEKKQAKTSLKTSPASIFERMEGWFERNDKTVFYAFCVLCGFVSVILFNARISEGGDDSTYILAGWEYSQHFFHYFYTFNAPLYPLFLSLPIKLFGVNILLLKFLSLPMQFFGIVFFYKAFAKRMPYLVLFPVLFFIAANSTLQYYSSQTYNESFYMFWQGLFFLSFVKLWDALNSDNNTFKDTWKRWLGFGVLTLILTLTKNVAIVLVAVIPFFFLVQRKWKDAVYSLASFGVVKVVFEALKRVLWGSVAKAQFQNQGNVLMLKDPYDATKGNDDLSGFVGRFFDNCNIYLSKRFFQIIGFRDPENIELYKELAFLVVILALIGLVMIIRSKNKLLLFASLYALSTLAATFVALQTRWDQPRLIITQMPFLVLIIFYAFYSFVKKGGFAQNLYLCLVLIFSFSLISTTLKQSAKNLPALGKNLRGDMYYGFTPDWVNFLKMSRWCTDSLPENTLVASRKAPMSFIYGKGKKFYPVYKVLFYDTATHQSNPDSVLALFKRDKVTHMLIASLRMDPARNSGNVINTLHNIIQPIMTKYPEKVILVHQEGEVEPSQLYEIRQ